MQNWRKCLSLLVALLLILSSTVARADDWTCPVCHQTFHFDPRDSAHKAAWIQIHLAAHGSASTSSSNPVVQGLTPGLNNFFNSIGQAMAQRIFGNPQQQQQQQQQLQQLQAQEAARLAEEQRQRAAERMRQQQELHQRLLANLKPLEGTGGNLVAKSLDGASPSGQLAPKGLDDTALAPKGTSFFGLGGDQPAQAIDPAAEKQNVSRAAYLASKAVTANSADADVLMDEALRVADGEPPFFQIPDNDVPAISDQGLIAFQKANIAYRQARADDITGAKDLARTERNYQIAQEAVRQLQQPATDMRDAASSKSLLQEAKALDQHLLAEREEARQKAQYAQVKTEWMNTLRRLAIRSLVDPDPAIADLMIRDSDPLSPVFRQRLRDAEQLYLTGSTDREKLRGKAALEQARADAINDLRARLWAHEELKEAERKYPIKREDYESPEIITAEQQADRLLKKGLVLPDGILDYSRPKRGFLDDMLLNEWIGPKNPEGPSVKLNPAKEELKRQALIQNLYTRRKRQEEMDALLKKYPATDPLFYYRIMALSPSFDK
jgi:hypothetical protein